MKIVGVILTIFMAINVVASAPPGLCNIDKTLCSTSENCLNNNSSDTQDSKPETTDSSHAHCASFFAHHYATPNLSVSVIFNSKENSNYYSYSFTFIQTYREGPFRPPLS